MVCGWAIAPPGAPPFTRRQHSGPTPTLIYTWSLWAQDLPHSTCTSSQGKVRRWHSLLMFFEYGEDCRRRAVGVGGARIPPRC